MSSFIRVRDKKTGNIVEIPIAKIGKSAYEIALKYGFEGTEEEWIASLKGEQGPEGPQGIQGEKGDKGDPGDQGPKGDSGNGITSIEKTSSSGLIDTYTITFTDNTTATFNITNGKDGEGASYIVPSYWESEINETVTSIKSIQEAGDHAVVCFGMVSDIHMDNATYPFCKNIGIVSAAVMDQSDIPLFVVSGDMLTGDTGQTKEQMLGNYDLLNNTLAPIGDDRIIMVYGNHDGAYGSTPVEGGNPITYDYGMTDGELYNKIFRQQAKDFRRVFGDDGVYYYIDNVPQKFRMICLDGRFCKYIEDADGTAIMNRMKTGGFGGNQLKWLIEKALNLEEGWSAIIVNHVPPKSKGREVNDRDYSIFNNIIKNFINKTKISDNDGNLIHQTYNGTYDWMDVDVTIDFTNSQGELIGLFCGHDHIDNVIFDYLPCPIFITTCATRYKPYDGTESERIRDTSTETAIDFYCINTRDKTVSIVRCGHGSDRTWHYGRYTIDFQSTGYSISNSSRSVRYGESYSTTLTPDSNYSIDSITVVMDGIDISSSVVSGNTINISEVTGNVVITPIIHEIVATKYRINATNVKNCTIDGPSEVDINGSYTSTIVPDTDCIFMGDITITMGTEDITSTALSGNTINIDTVTGDITINAVARTNFADTTPIDDGESPSLTTKWLTGYRLNSTNVIAYADGGETFITTNMVDIEATDKVYLYNLDMVPDNMAAYSIYLQTLNKTTDGTSLLCNSRVNTNISDKYDAELGCYIFDGNIGAGYIRFCGTLKTTADDVIINIKRNDEWL